MPVRFLAGRLAEFACLPGGLSLQLWADRIIPPKEYSARFAAIQLSLAKFEAIQNDL